MCEVEAAPNIKTLEYTIYGTVHSNLVGPWSSRLFVSDKLASVLRIICLLPDQSALIPWHRSIPDQTGRQQPTILAEGRMVFFPTSSLFLEIPLRLKSHGQSLLLVLCGLVFLLPFSEFKQPSPVHHSCHSLVHNWILPGR